jgi:hypothetical protein
MSARFFGRFDRPACINASHFKFYFRFLRSGHTAQRSALPCTRFSAKAHFDPKTIEMMSPIFGGYFLEGFSRFKHHEIPRKLRRPVLKITLNPELQFTF